MTKGILIDVENKAVREVEFEGLKGMYELIGCDYVEPIRFAGNIDVWVDEEGRLKEATKGFVVAGLEPIMGSGLVTGHDGEGNTTDCPVLVNMVTEVVTFIDYDDPNAAPQPSAIVISWE